MNNPLNLKKSMTILLTLVILLSIVAPALARESNLAPLGQLPPAPRLQHGPADPAELEAFLDKLLDQELADYHIAGAAISVVKDGKLFFAKGYGYADLEKRIPVDAGQTVFHIGSVGKLFTWTAVMQLVEQGKLDLNADVNTYLDFRIPDTYPQPITLKHLMTHSAGFEDRAYERDALSPNDFVPIREWLVSHLPARVRPPGDEVAYSNYGGALAGYIVARVSGQPYDQYIQQHILDPLGMTHSSAQVPMPPDLHAQASQGYTFVQGAFQAFPEYMTQVATTPAGGQYATVTDMARFMIAQLQGGQYSDASIAGARILKESTAQLMHATQFTPDPHVMGATYGFFDFSDNGQRTIGHGGEAYPFNMLMLLLPDQNLGVFVVYTSPGGGELTLQHLGFQRAFFDHYYPVPAADPVKPPANFAEQAVRFEGAYRSSWSSYTTLEKYKDILAETEISAPGDGTLQLATPYGTYRFVEVEPLYFRQVDGQFGIVFREDGQGRITHLFTDFTPMMAFEKLNWTETTSFNMTLLLACLLVFLSVIPVAAIRSIRNRRPNNDRTPAPRGGRVANRIILGICVLNLLFVAGNVLWGEANLVPLFGVTLIYKIVLGLGVLSAMLTAGALVYTVLAWLHRYRGVAARVYYTLVTIAAIAFVWFLNNWNLLGWRF